MTAPQLNALAEAMRAQVRRDKCGDTCITGRRGNVHADCSGLSVFISLARPSALERAISVLKPFSVVRQLGDAEPVLFIEKNAISAPLARLLRSLLKIPKRREVSEATLQRLRRTGFQTIGITVPVRKGGNP
jgi:hypothetical protein